MRLPLLPALGAILLSPAVALACPFCAGRDQLGPWTQALIAAILTLPFLIVASVARAVRRAERSEAALQAPGR